MQMAVLPGAIEVDLPGVKPGHDTGGRAVFTRDADIHTDIDQGVLRS
jgi:hypothetical protein